MPARVIDVQGRPYIRITFQNEDRKLGSWRGDKLTKQTATELVHYINQQILNGHFKWDLWFPKERRKFLVSELVWRYAASRTRKPSSQANLERMIKRFIEPVLGDKDVRDLHRIDFHWIKETLSDRLPLASALRAQIQGFMNWCYREEIIERPVMLPEIKLPKTATPYLSTEERELILSKVQDPYKAPATLSVDMGLRVGEIAALKWSDIDWHDNGIFVRRTLSNYVVTESPKEGDEKWLPMTSRVRQVLIDLKSKVHFLSPWVFVSVTGKQLRPQRIAEAWRMSAKSVGTKSRLHDNRHSLIADHLSQGRTLEEAGALVGHHNRNTTQRYARVQKARLRSLVLSGQNLESPAVEPRQ